MHDDVAAARERRVFRLDERRLGQIGAGRIFGAVDEAEQVSGIEIAKAMNLIGDGYGVAERLENEPLELKTHVGAIGPDVEQQISRRRHRGVRRSPDLGERPQLCRTARLSKSIPGGAADRHVARQPALQIPKPDRAQQSANIGNHAAHLADGVRRAADRHHQKYRGARQRRQDALRLNRNAVRGIDHWQ